jgi:hypothetical protein
MDEGARACQCEPNQCGADDRDDRSNGAATGLTGEGIQQESANLRTDSTITGATKPRIRSACRLPPYVS